LPADAAAPAPAAPDLRSPEEAAADANWDRIQQERHMSPLVVAAGQILYPIVSDLFKSHGSKTSSRNAQIVDQAAPALVELAKRVTGQPTAEQAVSAIQQDVGTRERFRAVVADDIDRIIGAIARLTDIEDDSMDRAAARAKGDDVINASTPVLIYGALGGVAAVFVALLLMLVLQTVLMPDHRPMGELVALFISTCGIVTGFAVSIYSYRFSSSAGSKASGDALRAIAADKK
jgi:hypothetical protein